MDDAYTAAAQEAARFLANKGANASSLYEKAKQLAIANENFRHVAATLAERFEWTGRLEWNVLYWKDPLFNEVMVDFR